jgi:5-(aminomethyl)-3-furanmethanol phosphate kinase
MSATGLDDRPIVRVAKVGGSLLDWPALPVALRDWLNEQRSAVNVLVCGGGELANVIRRADRDFALGEEVAHWLCIDALGVSARVLAAILKGVPLCQAYADLVARTKSRTVGDLVFDPREFLRRHEPVLPGAKLPHSWDVTTDSIAARLATALVADELVLLKSVATAAAISPAELAAAGYADGHFAKAAEALPSIQVVSLRASAINDAQKTK